MPNPLRAAIYARISQDDGSALGVARQESDCRALAESRGWSVVRVFVDNDVSASSGKIRPAFRDMMRGIENGDFDALAVWDIDRLTRTPRELEDIIDLADRRSLALASVGGEVDLSTPTGRMTARVKGTVARHEVEQMSRRIKRKSDERAESGTPHGPIGYGFKRVDGRDTAYEPEAAIIRELARRILSGESIRSLASELNARGVPGPRGGVWYTKTIRQLMMRGSIAGLRRHRGEIVGSSTGDALIDRDTFDRLCAFLTDPSRSGEGKGKPPSHLLSGIAYCGVCGATVRALNGFTSTKTGKTLKPGYACQSCFKIRRQKEPVDALIEKVIVKRLSSPDALSGFDRGDRAAEIEARDAIAAITARLNLAADQYAEDVIDGEQMARISARLRADRERWERALSESMPRALPAVLAGPNPVERWEAATLEQRRAAVAALAKVTILPTTSRGVFDPASVRVDWL